MPKPPPMDVHSHSEHSVDGSYTVKKMCESAHEKGIPVYAVTDHYDIANGQTDFIVLDVSLKLSLADVQAEKARYADNMKVLAGIELGQHFANLPKAEEILRTHDFDFVLGSVHNPPGGLDFYYYNPEDENYHLDAQLESYFLALLAMVQWGGFDSAAHLTYPFRYIQRLDEHYPFAKWDAHLETVVKALAEKGLAMEINTSGAKRRPSHMMPEARWVKRFKELGGEKLTLGADAHGPQNIGAGILEGVQIAKDAGFSHLCYFERRTPQLISIADD